MINSRNNFTAAKVATGETVVKGLQYNYLIDMINQLVKILSISSTGGLTISSAGLLTLGNELEALQVLSDAAGFVKKSGDATYAIDATEYQPHGNELDALQALEDSEGFVVKDGDGAYSIDDNVYATSASADNNAIAYAIALGG
jgi:hypothetical protein